MLEDLSVIELTDIVQKYPWYSIARKALCRNLFVSGDFQWRKTQYLENIVYMPSRKAFYSFFESIVCDSSNGREVKVASPSKSKVLPGDFFSQDDYEKVEGTVAPVFDFSVEGAENGNAEFNQDLDFCTETLAEIYLQQGYVDLAKRIYSKLILANPEKSVYFASLIEKLDKLN